MNPGVGAKVIAACSGLTAFAVAMIAGLAADNPADVVLSRALIALVACNFIGWFVGLACEHTVKNALHAFTSAQAPGTSAQRESSVDTTEPEEVPLV